MLRPAKALGKDRCERLGHPVAGSVGGAWLAQSQAFTEEIYNWLQTNPEDRYSKCSSELGNEFTGEINE